MPAAAKKVGLKFTTWENLRTKFAGVQRMDTAVNQKVDLIDLLAGTAPSCMAQRYGSATP